MAKGKIIVRNAPYIRNANLIGAGNKFAPIRDNSGNVQWQLSVAKQAAPQMQTSSLISRMESTAKTMGFDSRSFTPKISYNTPSK